MGGVGDLVPSFVEIRIVVVSQVHEALSEAL
jgi:hypothetical protein